jgi:hypothetical protein
MKNFRQLSKSVAKQKLTTEAKEKTEYDYEGDMARGQLRSVINNAQRVHDMLEDNDNLPEWVQSKITLAEDYISTVANYMMSEIDEEVDQIDELSNDMLGRYKTAAGADASKADKAGDYNKGNKRFGGIVKATKKQFANDMKKEEVEGTKLQESGGDVVFKKGDDHIEKYGEDSFALYKNGKKEKYYTSIEAAKKAMNEEKDTTPPFDGPYSKTSSVTTDKSGAKHGPMSVARHLAKQAMQRQSASLKKPVKEQAMSNKAKIVKDAAKKKKTGESEDAFQSEPIMTKSPTKNY